MRQRKVHIRPDRRIQQVTFVLDTLVPVHPAVLCSSTIFLTLCQSCDPYLVNKPDAEMSYNLLVDVLKHLRSRY
jgi:hypothetical protein